MGASERPVGFAALAVAAAFGALPHALVAYDDSLGTHVTAGR
jgi:hypothetical protein